MMDAKMKAAYDAWYLEAWERGVVRSAIDGIEWVLDYLRSQQEPVGEAGKMPGSDGFTLAAFRAADVPVGTQLYANPIPSAPAVPEGWLAAVEWLQGLADRQSSQRDSRFTRLIAGQLRAAAPQPKPAPVSVPEVTEAMVTAYLKAQAEAVQAVDDAFGRFGKAPEYMYPVRGACMAGLRAAFAAAPSPTEKKENSHD